MDAEAFLRRLYEAIQRRDIDAIRAMSTPDVVIDDTRLAPDGRVWKGHDSSYWDQLFERWDDFEAEPEEVHGAADRLFAVVRMSGRGAMSRVPMETRIAWVWRLRDGSIARAVGYRDIDEARAEFLDRQGRKA